LASNEVKILGHKQTFELFSMKTCDEPLGALASAAGKHEPISSQCRLKIDYDNYYNASLKID